MVRLKIGMTRPVRTFGDEYKLVCDSQDVVDILWDIGKEKELSEWPCLFVKLGDGYYKEVWGLPHSVPRLNDYAELLYYENRYGESDMPSKDRIRKIICIAKCGLPMVGPSPWASPKVERKGRNTYIFFNSYIEKVGPYLRKEKIPLSYKIVVNPEGKVIGVYMKYGDKVKKLDWKYINNFVCAVDCDRRMGE